MPHNLNPEYGIELGFNSVVEIQDSSVVKTSIDPFPSEGDTVRFLEELAEYHAALLEEPLTVAGLLGAEVVELEDGFHARHTYDKIDGPSVTRLEGDTLQSALATTIGQVADMDVLRGRNLLKNPWDAKTDNLHDEGDGPALTDFVPVLTRRGDGSFPSERLSGTDAKIGRVSALPWLMATKSGVITALLSTAINRGNSPIERVDHIIRKTDDWCYDALPRDIDPVIKGKVRAQIATHFIPYFGRRAIAAATKKVFYPNNSD